MRVMIRIEPVRPMEDECSKGILSNDAMKLVDARFFEVLREVHKVPFTCPNAKMVIQLSHLGGAGPTMEYLEMCPYRPLNSPGRQDLFSPPDLG
jgi:hypothetical protein